MRYVIIGCEAGHDVSVLDERPETFYNLPPDFRGRAVEGEVLSQPVLERAGIQGADGVAAVTSSDAHNAVLARLARTVYGVERILVRNYDPRWRAMHDVFGMQVISSSTWSAQRLEQLMLGQEARPLLSAGNGEVTVFEIPVPESWYGRPLGELVPPGTCRVVALTRAGRAVIPTGMETLESGDLLHLSATDAGIETVRGRLQGVRRG